MHLQVAYAPLLLSQIWNFSYPPSPLDKIDEIKIKVWEAFAGWCHFSSRLAPAGGTVMWQHCHYAWLLPWCKWLAHAISCWLLLNTSRGANTMSCPRCKLWWWRQIVILLPHKRKGQHGPWVSIPKDINFVCMCISCTPVYCMQETAVVSEVFNLLACPSPLLASVLQIAYCYIQSWRFPAWDIKLSCIKADRQLLQLYILTTTRRTTKYIWMLLNQARRTSGLGLM